MNLYLSDAQIPGFASLTAAQRRAVFLDAFRMLFNEHPFAFLMAGIPSGIGGSIGAAVGCFTMRMLPENSNYRLVAFGLSAATFGCCGGFITTQLIIKRMLPYFHRLIEKNKAGLRGTV
jgi:hypothetical protein